MSQVNEVMGALTLRPLVSQVTNSEYHWFVPVLLHRLSHVKRERLLSSHRHAESSPQKNNRQGLISARRPVGRPKVASANRLSSNPQTRSVIYARYLQYTGCIEWLILTLNFLYFAIIAVKHSKFGLKTVFLTCVPEGIAQRNRNQYKNVCF